VAGGWHNAAVLWDAAPRHALLLAAACFAPHRACRRGDNGREETKWWHMFGLLGTSIIMTAPFVCGLLPDTIAK
jgi:hypothetical protein